MGYKEIFIRACPWSTFLAEAGRDQFLQRIDDLPGLRTAGARRAKARAVAPPRAAATPEGASAGASTQHLSPSAGGRLLRRFAGFGNRSLGTIVVHSLGVLEWNALRRPIQIFTMRGFMLVSSKAAHGTILLSPGTYRGVRVASASAWSIELRSWSSR